MLPISPDEKNAGDKINVWSHRASERAINTKESILNSIDGTQVWKTARAISTEGRVEHSRSCSRVILLLNNWIVQDCRKSQSFFLIQINIVFIYYYIRKGFKILIYLGKCWLYSQFIYTHKFYRTKKKAKKAGLKCDFKIERGLFPGTTSNFTHFLVHLQILKQLYLRSRS